MKSILSKVMILLGVLILIIGSINIFGINKAYAVNLKGIGNFNSNIVKEFQGTNVNSNAYFINNIDQSRKLDNPNKEDKLEIVKEETQKPYEYEDNKGRISEEQSKMPKAGEMPVCIYYSLGTALIGLGISAGRKNKNKNK